MTRRQARPGLVIPALLVVAGLAAGLQAQCAITGTLPPTLPSMQVGSTAGAPNHATPTCNGGGNDNLWVYTATCTTQHVISLCGSGYDTILDVFSGDPCLGGASIGCNDDSCGLQSEVNANMTQGTTYWILVDGWNGSTGSYTLNINGTCPIVPCSVAGIIPPVAPTSVIGDTSATGRDEVVPSCGGNADDEVWTFTAPCDSTYTFSLCGGTTAFNSVLEVFDGDPCVGAMSLGCNDDFCGAQSEVSVFMGLGDTVFVVVDGIAGAAGPYTLDVTSTGCPCSIAGAIPSQPSVVHPGDTSTTSSDQILPSCTSLSGGDEQIWAYTAPCDATYTVNLCNGTATFDTVLAVFDSDPCLGGMEIACNDDACGTQSEVVVGLLAGNTYYFVVDSGAGGVGAYDLQITSTGCISPWLLDAPPCLPSGGSIDIPLLADSGVQGQGAAQYRVTWDPGVFSLDGSFGTGGFQFGAGWDGAANTSNPGELYVASWYLPPPPAPTGMYTMGTFRLTHSGVLGNTQIDGLVEVWADQGLVDIGTVPFWMTSATPAIGCIACTLCGDCNQSATGPDIIDSLTAAQIAVGLITPTPTQGFCCDVDADVDIDVLDALVIAQSAVGLPVPLTCP